MALRHMETTDITLNAYFQVWNHTPRIYPEKVFERCMQLELLPKIGCERQKEFHILYKGVKVGVHQLDLFVGDEVPVELKVVPELTALHRAQLISYIKATGKTDGLLLNFGGREPEFERLFYNKPKYSMAPGTVREVRERTARYHAPNLVYQIKGALFEVFRHLTSGFVHRIYANACNHELTLRGLSPLELPDFAVIYKGRFTETIKFKHFQIGDILVFPIAHTDPNALPPERIREHLIYRKLPLAIMANFQTDELLSPVIVPAPRRYR